MKHGSCILDHKSNLFWNSCINKLITTLLTIFRRCPTSFRRFSKIFLKAWRTFPNNPNILQRLPKITEDFRVGTDDVSIVQQHIWVLLKRLCDYSNGKLKICENNVIFTCENIMFTRESSPCISLAPVIQKMDNAIHRINHYPADSVVWFV